jgi:hypothetical protein
MVNDNLFKIDLENLWKYNQIGLINAHILTKFEVKNIPLFFEIYEIKYMSCPVLMFSSDIVKVNRKRNVISFLFKKDKFQTKDK